MALSKAVAAVAIVAAAAAPAFGQAWPAPAGAGAVTLSTQVVNNAGHRQTDGYLLPDGKSRTAAVVVEVDYAITDRLSVSAGVPYVFAKFLGPGPSPARLPVDECRCWNSGWQDLSGTMRFAVLDGDFALTPSISVGVPTHAYQFEGEAVVGYRLREVRLGVDAGLRLAPRVALMGRYAYAIVEDVLDVPNNRSHWSVAAAVAMSPRLSARYGVQWQRTHGGLRFGSETGRPFPPPGEASTEALFRQHDRLLRDNYWHLGAGATYALTRADVFVSVLQFQGGTDTHAGYAVTVGASVPFRR